MMIDYPSVKQLLFDIQRPDKAPLVFKNIQTHSKDPRFLMLLQAAIRDQKLPFNTRIAGAVVLSKAIEQLCQQIDEEILAKTVMELITDLRVDYKIKLALEQSLTSIIQLSNQNLFLKLLDNTAELLMIRRQQSSMQIEQDHKGTITENVNIATFILRCLLNSQAYFPILAKAILQEFLGSKLFSIVGCLVKQTETLIGLTDFLKQVLVNCRNGKQQEHSLLLRQLSKNQQLTQWVFFLYKHNDSQGQICFIHPQSPLDHQDVRKLKVAAAQLHQQILLGLQTCSQGINEEITKTHLSQATGIVDTISFFIGFKNFCKVYQQFIIELLGIIVLLIKLFGVEFQHNYPRILHTVTFPLLSANEEQMKTFAQDPTEFNNLAEDCCDKQQYGILKTQAGRLLQVICDQINSAYTYTIQHVITSIKARLYHGSSIQQNIHNFQTIQQAFTVLAILSYRIAKNQAQLQEMRSILVVQELKSKISPIQLARIFQFLAYNYQDMYYDYALGQSWINLALTVSVEQVQSYPSLAYSALDFISNIFQNFFIQRVALKYLQQMNYCKNYEICYKILQKLVSKHFMKFSEEGLSLALQKLLEAVLIDVNNYEQKTKSHTMDITYSLHAFRKIAQKYQHIQKGSLIRDRIWQVVTRLQLFLKINLDDEIVNILTALVKREGVTPQISSAIPTLINIFRKEYSQSAYIVFFNEILVRAADPVACGLFYPLLEGAMHLHSNILRQPTSSTSNLGLGNILLVLQHVVLIYGQTMKPQVLKEIAETAMLIIPLSDQPEDRTEPIIIARSLNLLYVCHIYQRNERALRRMFEFSESFIFKSHDLKVLALCLIKDMFLQSDIISVTEMIILLVNCIWTARQQAAKVKPKRKSKVEIKSTLIKIHKFTNYEVSLQTMTSPFSKNILPEIELRQALSRMKQNNSSVYQIIIKSLPSKVSQRLRQLISQVNIEGHRRRIVKIGGEKINGGPRVRASSPKKRSLWQSEDESEQMVQDDEDTSYKKRLIKKKRKQEMLSSKL